MNLLNSLTRSIITRLHKYLIKTAKILAWIIGSVLLVLVLVNVAIRLPSIQNFIVQKVVRTISEKTGATISLGRIVISFPKTIVVENLYMEDQKKDTLVYLEELKVNAALSGLLRKKIYIRKVSLSTSTVNLYRPSGDSTFNFSFIADSLSSTQHDATTSTKSKNPWEISLGRLDLNDIRFSYLDSLSGLNLTSRIGKLSVDINKLNLDSLGFDIDDIALSNTVVQMSMYGQTSQTTENSQGSAPCIDLGEIHLDNVNFDMDDSSGQLNLEALAGKLDIRVDQFDLQRQKIVLESLSCENTNVKFRSFSSAGKEAVKTEPVSKESVNIPWYVGVNDLSIKNTAFSMDNTAYADALKSFDPNHIRINDFEMQAKSLVYAGSTIKANIDNFAFKEDHGFALKKLSGNLEVTDTSVTANQFVLLTNGTDIRQNVKFRFESLGGISNHIAGIRTDMKTEIDKLDPQDLEFFVPGLFTSLPFNLDSLRPFKLSVAVNGKLDSLDIRELSVDILDSTRLTLKGSVMGLPEIKNLEINSANLDFSTTRSDLVRTSLDTLIPESIEIPEKVSINASLKGNERDLDAVVQLVTSFGTLSVEGNLSQPENTMISYNVTASSKNFRTGLLLGDTAIYGQAGFRIKAKGNDFDPITMKTTANIDIDSFTFQDYRYRDLHFTAGADSGVYSLNARIKDPYIDLDLDGSLAYDTLEPKLDLTVDLKGINLQKLGLSKEDIRAKGKLIARLSGITAGNLNGKIETRDILIIKNNELYPVDSLIFVSINDSAKTEIDVHSDFLNATYAGTLKVDKLADALKNHFSRYFQIDGEIIHSPGNDSFKFDVNIKSSALLTQVIVPGLEKLDPGNFHGEFNESDHRLSIEANLPVIGYRGNVVRNLKLDINSGNDAISADVDIDRLEISGYYISGILLQSKIASNNIDGSLSIQQKEDEESAYDIPFRLRKSDTLYLLSFPEQSIVLNSRTWKFANTDAIRLSDLASGNWDMQLSDEKETMRFTGKGKRFRAELRNFRMSNFGNILSTTSGVTLMQGIADGEFILDKKPTFDSIDAAFTIDNMNIFENPVGNLKINLEHHHPGFLKGKISISNANELQFDLNRIPLDTSQTLDIKLQFNKLQLTTFDGFLPGRADSLLGWTTGEIDIGNTLQKPETNGELTFHKANLHLATFGSYFGIADQKIRIDRNNIIFPKFTLDDNQDGHLTIDGKIGNEYFKNFEADLKVNANNFRVIDKTTGDPDPYKGVLVFSTSIKITGPLNDLNINSGITINDATDITMTLPESHPASSTYKGVVEFVDRDRSLNPILVDTSGREISFSRNGITVSANIDIEKKAALAMIVDQRAGDKLWVKGSANLNFHIDQTGLPSLSGRYNLDDGGYKLTLFNITQREFNLQDGSFIVWTGEPMEAKLHIDATYKVNTSPYNLIIDQTNNVAGAEVKQYRQKLPFTVILMIRGEINAPIIDFNIKLPADKRAIYNGVVQSKLNELEAPGNESNLNKQVLSLLAFKQFMPQNPLEMGGESSGLGSTARTSVSRLLSNQLNNFSEKYIKGVSVNFNVQSYDQYSESSGVEQRTELGVGLSKSFFNNRLEVSVGSNVELQSEKYRQQNSFNDIAEDIEVEYKLTENGVYRAKAFRNQQYEQFEGDIIQSGLSLIFNKDFNHLRQIFSDSDSTKLMKEDKRK